jgi:Ribbon-helix-helix protein, copG family
MAAQNTIHVSDELLAELQSRAAAEGKTLDELAEEAVRRLLDHRGLDALAQRGRRHAQRVGRKPSDAVAVVREIRRER